MVEKGGKKFNRAPIIFLSFRRNRWRRKKKEKETISEKILLSSDEIPEVEERVPPLGDEGAEQ